MLEAKDTTTTMSYKKVLTLHDETSLTNCYYTWYPTVSNKSLFNMSRHDFHR